MAEGWALLRSTALIRFDAVRPEAPTSAVEEVDAWENRWFPVIDATLRRSFPDVHAKVLLNLSQTDGPPVILSVATLLERLDALRAATDPVSKAATEKLEIRGVTQAVLDQVRSVIASVSKVSTTPAPAISEEEAQRSHADACLRPGTRHRLRHDSFPCQQSATGRFTSSAPRPIMRAMTILLSALLVAIVLPFVWATVSTILCKKELGALDNHHPRSLHTNMKGPAARAFAAQQNAWEALGVFAPCALLAHFGNPTASLVTTLALVFIVARVLHGVVYVANIAPARTLLFTIGVAASIGLFLVGAKVL